MDWSFWRLSLKEASSLRFLSVNSFYSFESNDFESEIVDSLDFNGFNSVDSLVFVFNRLLFCLVSRFLCFFAFWDLNRYSS